MVNGLDRYRKIVGNEAVERIFEEARGLRKKHVVHVNSTLYGGGVAEMLNSIVYLMNQAGVDTGWRVMKGTPEFFVVTKKFHNALQGERIDASVSRKRVYYKINKRFAEISHFEHHDFVIVHDVQPLPLINYKKKRQPWIWRCHVDLSDPEPNTYNYLKKFIAKYDCIVISNKKFACPVRGKCSVIFPSIDPLSAKNKEMKPQKIAKILRRRGIDLNKPIVSQVSRFDKWKDHFGVIEAFKRVRKRVDCQLVLLGSMADDDPEGPILYKRILDNSKRLKDVHVLAEYNDYLVNALQRASSVVLQKSIREGFGLTVSEAMWKGKPVIGGNAGGIPLQIKNNETGFIVRNINTCSKRMLFLLKNPEKAEEMGARGKEFVKENFLVTRHLVDYFRLLKSL